MPPANEEVATAAVPSAGGAKIVNGGGRVKGRRAVKSGAVKGGFFYTQYGLKGTAYKEQEMVVEFVKQIRNEAR